LVIANHLNFSQLKKRIIMMSRNPSQRLALAKYGFAAPVFLLIVALLASPKTKVLATTAALGETMTTAFEEPLSGNPQTVKPKSIFSEILNLVSTSDSSRKPPFDVVKNPIPNPMVRLASRAYGVISLKTFQNQTALSLVQPQYSYPVVCAIQSFQVVRVPFGSKNNEESKNTGQKFNAETLALIQHAQNGDSYQFVNIKGRCPGDAVARDLGNLTFTIGENQEDALKEQLNDKYVSDVEMAKNLNLKSDCGMKEGDTGQMPVFQGGEAEIGKFIYANLRYPESAKKEGREGLIFISYIVGTDGLVTDVHSWKTKWANPRLSTSAQSRVALDALDQPLVDEAIRVVGSMPRWKPGTRNGVISCHFKHVIIKFQIEK
jgi:hypothetical protein